MCAGPLSLGPLSELPLPAEPASLLLRHGGAAWLDHASKPRRDACLGGVFLRGYHHHAIDRCLLFFLFLFIFIFFLSLCSPQLEIACSAGPGGPDGCPLWLWLQFAHVFNFSVVAGTGGPERRGLFSRLFCCFQSRAGGEPAAATVHTTQNRAAAKPPPYLGSEVLVQAFFHRRVFVSLFCALPNLTLAAARPTPIHTRCVPMS